jgi:hypothetical protein
MVFDGFYCAVIDYLSICLYECVCVFMFVSVQNIDDGSRTKSVKMRQKGITTI